MHRTNGPRWEKISTGIISIATVLAAATAAGFFALATQFTAGEIKGGSLLWIIVFLMLCASLTAYAIALVYGLQIPFCSEYNRKLHAAKVLAKSVGAQGILAVYAIIGLAVIVFLDHFQALS